MSWVGGSWGLRLNCTGPDTIPAATTGICDEIYWLPKTKGEAKALPLFEMGRLG